MDINLNLTQTPLPAQPDVSIEGTISTPSLPTEKSGSPVPAPEITISTPPNIELVTKLLSELNLPANEKNTALVNALISNQLPVTKMQLQKLNQLNQIFSLLEHTTSANPNATQANHTILEKSLFLLKNDLPVSTANAKILETLLTQHQGVTPEIKAFVSQLMDAPLADGQKLQLLAQFLDQNEVTADAPLVSNHLIFASEQLGQGQEQPIAPERTPLAPSPTQTASVPVTNGNVSGIPAPLNPSQPPLNASTAQPTVPADTPQQPNPATTPSPLPLAEGTIPLDPALTAPAPTESLTLSQHLETLLATHPELKEALVLSSAPQNDDTAKQWLSFKPEALERVLLERIALDPKAPKEKIDAKLNTLRENTEKMLEALPKEETTAQTRQTLLNIRDTLTFATQLQDSTYLPLPILMNNQPTEAALYILNNKKKTKKEKGENVSAVILLNTLGLGKVETFIQKQDKSLSIQFRLESDSVKTLFKRHVDDLKQHLHGYHLKGLTFSNLDKPFSLIAAEDTMDVTEMGHGVQFSAKV